MSITSAEGGREYDSNHICGFLNNAFGTPVAKDGSGMPTSWDVSRAKIVVDEDNGVVDIYDLDPAQRVYHPDDVKSEATVPRYFYSVFLLKSVVGWHGVLAEGGRSLNCRIPLVDFEAQCE
jgi:hypothetical protein